MYSIKKRYLIPAIIICIQLVDLFVHVAANQLEPIRVVSNILIVVWIFILHYNLITLETKTNVILIGTYVLLNIVFLLIHGLINSNNGNLRIPLFVFVGTTVIFSIFQIKAKTVN